MLMNASIPPREERAHMAMEVWTMHIERMVALKNYDNARDER